MPHQGTQQPTIAVVTGAAGFIGSHLVDALLDSGLTVVGVDRRCPQTDLLARSNLNRALPDPAFSLVHTDLGYADLDPIVTGADCVFHLAAVPGVRRSWGAAFPEYVAANVSATARLVAACERTGVRRLVYASSSSVYGAAETPSRESDPTHPLSPYGVTKLAGEQLCLAHARLSQSRLTVAALRYFTVYGPRQRPDMAVGRLLSAALTGGRYTLFGDGTQRRELTYVGDVVAATTAAAHFDRDTAVINVGGGASVSLIDLLGIAHTVTGRPVSLTAVEAQAGDVAATAADLTVARDLLGYEPHVDLPTGLARHTEWLRQLPTELLRAYLPPSGHVDTEATACSS